MKRLKIAFVLDDTLDSTDGVQQYVLTMGKWLSGQGHEVHYLAGQTDRTDLKHVHSLSRNLPVRFNGNRLSVPLPANWHAISRLLQREQFDILHVQMPYSPLLAQRVIRLVPPQTGVVGTFHVIPHSGFVYRANRWLGIWTRSSLKRFDKIVSVSRPAADFARAAYGISSEVLPNTVETGRFATAEPMPVRNRPLLLFLGRLVPRKGCMLLLQSLHWIKCQDPAWNFELVIAGRGPLERQLRDYVRLHDLDANVRFAGYVNEADKASYLKSADVAVFPSLGGESFGIVLLEAMAGGHAIVLAADNAGYAAVMEPYPDLLFPVSDPIGLAHKLRTFVDSADERRRALAWQQSYIRQFDVSAVGQRLMGIYEQACLRARQNMQ